VVYRYGVGVERSTIQNGDQHIHGTGKETHAEEEPLSNTGDMRYPDVDFEKDTGVHDTGERQD
jgi:hypothetical protein